MAKVKPLKDINEIKRQIETSLLLDDGSYSVERYEYDVCRLCRALLLHLGDECKVAKLLVDMDIFPANGSGWSCTRVLLYGYTLYHELKVNYV